MLRILLHLSKPARAVSGIGLLTRNYAVNRVSSISPISQLSRQYLTTQLLRNQCNRYSSSPQKTFTSPITLSAKRVHEKLQTNLISLTYVRFEDMLSWTDSPEFKKLSTKDSLFYLQKCSALVNYSKEQREKLVEAIWSKIIEQHQTPTVGSLIALLRAYRNIEKTIDNPKAFLDAYPTIETDRKIYDEFLYSASVGGNQPLFDKTLKLIAENGWQLNECNYNAWILHHSNNGSIEKCEEVLNTMTKDNIVAGPGTYKELVNAFMRANDKKRALDVLSKHGGWLTSYQLFDIIRCAISTHLHDDIIPRVFDLLEDGIVSNRLIFPELQNICIEILYKNKSTDRLDYDPYNIIMKNLPVPQFFNENTDCYGVFLLKDIIARGMSIDIALNYCDKLIASKRNEWALHVICVIALKNRSPIAVDLLRGLSKREPLRSHYFWHLFYIATNEAEMFDVIKLASELKTTLEVDTILSHIFPKITKTLNNSSLAYKMLVDSGLKPDRAKTAMLIYLLSLKKPVEALHIAEADVKKVNTDLLTKPTIACIISTKEEKFSFQIAKLINVVASVRGQKSIDWPAEILSEIARRPQEARNNFPNVIKLLNHFKTVRVKMSKNGVDAVLALLSKQRSIASKCHSLMQGLIDEKWVTKEIDTTPPNTVEAFEELENHLIELQSKNLNTRGLLGKSRFFFAIGLFRLLLFHFQGFYVVSTYWPSNKTGWNVRWKYGSCATKTILLTALPCCVPP